MRALYPGSGEVRIPRNAITDADGYAHVLCPNGAGSTWARVKAKPGQYFTCPSGYVGVVLMPKADSSTPSAQGVKRRLGDVPGPSIGVPPSGTADRADESLCRCVQKHRFPCRLREGVSYRECRIRRRAIDVKVYSAAPSLR